MKKALLIVMTVAILGVLGLYVDKKPATSKSPSSTPTSSNTLSANTGSTSSNSTASNNSSSSTGSFNDGTFTGSAADTPYGTVQIAVVISGGKITDVNFLQMPNDQGHSREVTAFAELALKQSTISSQSSNIQFVSGATDTSFGYQQSLQKALDQAA